MVSTATVKPCVPSFPRRLNPPKLLGRVGSSCGTAMLPGAAPAAVGRASMLAKPPKRALPHSI